MMKKLATIILILTFTLQSTNAFALRTKSARQATGLTGEIKGAMHAENKPAGTVFEPVFEEDETQQDMAQAQPHNRSFRFAFIREDEDATADAGLAGVKYVQINDNIELPETARSFIGFEKVSEARKQSRVKDPACAFLVSSSTLKRLAQINALGAIDPVVNHLKDNPHHVVILIAERGQVALMENLKSTFDAGIQDRIFVREAQEVPAMLRILSGHIKIYYKTQTEAGIPGTIAIDITQDILNKIGIIRQKNEQFEQFKDEIATLLQV